jgi:hypothetical protein
MGQNLQKKFSKYWRESLKNANTEGENCDIIKTIKDKTESVLS